MCQVPHQSAHVARTLLRAHRAMPTRASEGAPGSPVPKSAVTFAATCLLLGVEGDSERTKVALSAILETTARLRAILERLDRLDA